MTRHEITQSLNKLSMKMNSYRDRLTNEECTKNFLISPFLQTLGYDTNSPDDVVYEVPYTSGGKKDKRVDYAVYSGGALSFIVEAKTFNSDITSDNVQQLYNYFTQRDCSASIAVITNGDKYQFYTDLDRDNIMDDSPFYTFSLSSFNEKDVDFLLMMCKDNFNVDKIKGYAKGSSFDSLFDDWLRKQAENVSDDFVKCLRKEVLDIDEKELKVRVSSYLSNLLGVSHTTSKVKEDNWTFKTGKYSVDACDRKICTGTKLICIAFEGKVYTCASWTDVFSSLIEYLSDVKKLKCEEICMKSKDTFSLTTENVRIAKEKRGIYFESNASAISCVQRLSKLIKFFEIEPKDVILGICTKEDYKDIVSKDKVDIESIFRKL